jgi:putative nucleotidyltransferase with HDIG domain
VTVPSSARTTSQIQPSVGEAHVKVNPKGTIDGDRVGVVRDLPEIRDIGDSALQEKVIDGWLYALSQTRYRAIRDVPPWGTPNTFVLKRGSQADHLRGVAHLAVGFADEFKRSHPEIRVNRDIVLAGALCHDIGKPWEFEHQERWQADPSITGYPSVRHPAYGMHICFTVGLPEEIAHIAMAHSPGEGDQIVRSLECTMVRYADNTWWRIAGVSGLLERETMGPMGFPYSVRKTDLD